MWRIELLGPLRAACGETVLTRFGTEKNGVLLAILAYEGRQLSRVWVSGQIWPDAPAGDERKSLRVALTWLRRNITESNGVEMFHADRQSVGLNPTAYVTDVEEFERAVQTARVARETTEQQFHLEQALRLYRGPFLYGFEECSEEPWIETRRQRFEALYLEGLQLLVELHEKRGLWRPALDYALRGLEISPLSEVHRAAALRLALRAGEWAQSAAHCRELDKISADGAEGRLPLPLAELLPFLNRIEKAGQAATAPELSALERALSVSLSLLPANARRFLIQLAVFPGPFTVEEAATVLSEPHSASLLDLLKQRSLVTSTPASIALAQPETGDATGDAAPAYFCLSDLQRTSLWNHLLEEERRQLRSYHAEHWLCIARDLFYRFCQSGLGTLQALLPRHLPHFDAALDYWVRNDLDRSGTLISCLFSLYPRQPERKRNWVDALLSRPEISDDMRDYFIVHSMEILMGGANPEALEMIQQLVARYQEARVDESRSVHVEHLTAALLQLGIQAHHQEQDELAEQSLLTVLHISRMEHRPDSPPGIMANVSALSMLYETLMVQGRTAEAHRCLDTSAGQLAARSAVSKVPKIDRDLRTLLDYRYGCVLTIHGEYNSARHSIEKALNGFKLECIRHGEADCLSKLGAINLQQGRLVEARVLAGQSVVYYANLEHRESRAAALGGLGDVYARQGECDRARSCYQEGLAVWRERGHLRWQADFLARLAALECAQRKDDRAAELAAEARSLCSGTRSWQSTAIAAQVEGDLGRRSRQWGTAADRYREALGLRVRASHWLGMAELVEAFAVLALQQGQVDRAALLCAIVDRERIQHGAPRADGEYDRCLSGMAGELSRTLTLTSSSGARLGSQSTLDEITQALLQKK